MHGLSFALVPKLRPIARAGLVPAAHAAVLAWVCWNGWGGFNAMIDRYQARSDWPLYQHVRANATRDDVYLASHRWIDFRLKSHARIVTTHKSHPIKDTEVLEWKSRLEAVMAFDRAKGPQQMAAAIDHVVDAYGVTRVAVRQRSKQAAWLKAGYPLVYEDKQFAVYDATPAAQ